MSSTFAPITRPGGAHGLDVGEPGRRDREPGSAGGEPAPGPRVRARIDDRALMATLIPLFGVGIAHGAGLFDGLAPGDPARIWGHAWFVGGAALIYGANRALLFAGRAHADWFARPAAKLVLLATGIVFGTVPTTLVMLHGWKALTGLPIDQALVTVTLVNVICVLFVTWLYETLFLIRERVDDQVHLERMAAARTGAELDALRAQVDPHFLFNALNTLAALIDADSADARPFVDHLARVYRGLLDTRGRSLVPLGEELELARAYAGLLAVRFGGAVTVAFDVGSVDGVPRALAVPPGAAQVLLENAVRHNAVDPDAPLEVRVRVEGASGPEPRLVVEHDVRPRPPAPGAGVGLANLDARARLTTGRAVEVSAGATFRVAVPLRSDGAR